MDPTVATLVLFSAVLHPLWNAVIKRAENPEGGFIGLVFMLMIFGGAHSLAAGYDLMSAVKVWPLILLSWGGMTFYGTSLAITLRRGDLSTYYPIIRSSPLAVIAIGTLFLGESYSPRLLFGIAMVLAGAFGLQYRRGKRLLDDPATLGLAVLAMCGTGVYSIADSQMMQVIEPPVMFFWVELLSLPTYVLVFGVINGKEKSIGDLFFWVRLPLRYLGIGLICYSSYFMILTAYSLGGEVAAVTSVRQVSIPLSVLIGGLLLKEESMTRRLWSSLLLAFGIVVIVLTPAN
ncbi:MAG: hypothetical protein V3R66_06190 [Rhodospirillales bacterium]